MTATLALVLAIAGGAAYAVDKIHSRDIANNSVKSADLKNRKGVAGKDVKRDSLTGRDLAERTLSAGALTRLAGNETGTECVLQLIPRNCVTTPVALGRQSDLLVIATGNQESVGGAGQASCRISIDGVDEPLAVNPGEQSTDNTSPTATNGFARTLISKHPLAAGQHIVALSCKVLAGHVRINKPTIAAIAIAAD